MKLHPIKRQIIVLFVISVLVAIAGIIHGVFFDLDFEQIKRLTFTGFIFTLVVVFPALILIEYVFDLNNSKKFEELEKRLKKLERKK